MKSLTFLAILFLALVTTVLSLIGSGSYPRLTALRESVAAQREHNEELSTKITDLRQRVHAVRSDPRGLEKAARNELALARDGEVIVFFDEPDSAARARLGEAR